MAESELFERGLQARRDVLGAEYVDANLADTDEFMMAFQRVVTEWAWGYAWSRPGLDRKTRSMLNLAILTALGRPDELGIYVKGALATGVSVDEIKEILIHAGDARREPGSPPGWGYQGIRQPSVYNHIHAELIPGARVRAGPGRKPAHLLAGALVLPGAFQEGQVGAGIGGAVVNGSAGSGADHDVVGDTGQPVAVTHVVRPLTRPLHTASLRQLNC